MRIRSYELSAFIFLGALMVTILLAIAGCKEVEPVKQFKTIGGYNKYLEFTENNK